MGLRMVARKAEREAPRRGRLLFRMTLGQRAKARLRRVRFSSGRRIEPLELSPRLSARQFRQLEYWIGRLPPALLSRIPRLKLALSERLRPLCGKVRIEQTARATKPHPEAHTHANSYIVERYVVLEEGLFGRRVELGRILYHELCHFLWPRLGNPKRLQFAALVEQEFRRRTRGELGYSSEWRKQKLWAAGGSQFPGVGKQRLWRDYLCESFCDTGSFVLLGNERRANHSEYTLSRAARRRRVLRWEELMMGIRPAPGRRSRKTAARPSGG